MTDSGEVLVDIEARLHERMEEREAERRRRTATADAADRDQLRQVESLRLARKSLQDQVAVAQHPARRQQLEMALAEIARRLAAAGAA